MDRLPGHRNAIRRPDNYMATHSILFTFDTYTQTGVMLSFMLNQQWMVAGQPHRRHGHGPVVRGATPTGMFGVRWVAEDNKDSFYTCLNNINSASFATSRKMTRPPDTTTSITS